MKNQNEKKLPEGAVAAAATCYAAFEGEGGEWGVEQHGCVVYDACCGFDEDTAELMAEVMNEGKGLDAWCEHEDENADLLRDRLIERGWVDPMRHNAEVARESGKKTL